MIVWHRGAARWLVVTAVTSVLLGGCAIFEERSYPRHGSIKDDHPEAGPPRRKRLVAARPQRDHAAVARRDAMVPPDAPKAPRGQAEAVAPPAASPAPVIAAPAPVAPAPQATPKTVGSAVVVAPPLPVAPPPALTPPPMALPAPTAKPAPVQERAAEPKPEAKPEPTPQQKSEPLRESKLTTGSLPDLNPHEMARRVFGDGQRLFADGKVMEARRRFVSVLGAMPAEATLALARSFDNHYLARLQSSDGAPDTLRALQLYGRAAERGAEEARADLARVQATFSSPRKK